jgi:cytochrome P450
MALLGRLEAAAIMALGAGALAVEKLTTGVVFNPLGPAQQRDPYDGYRALRERDPVHRTIAGIGWVVTRYQDVVELLKEPRLSADDRHFKYWKQMRRRAIRDGLVDPSRPEAPTMLRLDPPDHTRLRSLVSKAFTPRAVERLRGRVEEVTDQLLAGVGARREFDVVRELAVPLPVIVIAEMLGIPAEDRDTFKRWSDALVGFLDPQAGPGPRRIRQSIDQLRAYVDRVAEARRAEPRDDLMSALVAAEDAGDRLTTDELYGTVALLLAAGNLTTTHLIGNGLVALLAHRRELERLRDEPAIAPRAVEELLRYDSPVQSTGRVVVEDFRFRGKRFRRGQNVIMSLGAANRDPAAFREPDRLDLGRDDTPHLSFSHGPHFCLGAQLARLEVAVALPRLLRRFPGIQLGSGLGWGRYLFLRGPSALPVRV